MKHCFLITLSRPLRVTIPVALVLRTLKAVMSAAPSASTARAKALPPPQALGRGILYPNPSAVSSIAGDRSPKPDPRKGPLRRCAPLRGSGFGLLWSRDRRRRRRGGDRGCGVAKREVRATSLKPRGQDGTAESPEINATAKSLFGHTLFDAGERMHIPADFFVLELIGRFARGNHH